MELTTTSDLIETGFLTAVHSSSSTSKNLADVATRHNMTKEQLECYLAHLSDSMALTLLPVMLVLGLIMILGTLGNSLVFYIYLTRFHACSTRSAILSLAGFDVIACVIGIPGEIIDMRYSFNFYNEFQCRSMRLMTSIALVASGLILMSVAHDRYQHICHPLRKQITAKQAWHRVMYGCLLSIILSLPGLIIYGLSPVPTSISGVYGMECSTSSQFRQHVLPIMYYILQCSVFLFTTLIMITMYILIGRQLLRQQHFRSSVKQPRCHGVAPNGTVDRPRRPTMSNSEEHSPGAADHKAQHPLSAAPYCVTTKEEEASTSSSNQRSSTAKGESSTSKDVDMVKPDLHSNISTSKSQPASPTFDEPKLTRKRSFLSGKRRCAGPAEVRTRKTTLMLGFITAVFIISFLPHLLLKALQAVDKGFMSSLHTAGLVTYNIFVRSYFFNTAVNFFIYGFCSPRFRQECRKLMLKIAFWKKHRKVSIQNSDHQ